MKKLDNPLATNGNQTTCKFTLDLVKMKICDAHAYVIDVDDHGVVLLENNCRYACVDSAAPLKNRWHLMNLCLMRPHFLKMVCLFVTYLMKGTVGVVWGLRVGGLALRV